MKKCYLVLLVLVAASLSFAETKGIESAFIAIKDHEVVSEIGKCDERHAPYSTFKIALAAIGFDAGILKNKDSPKWAFKKDYEKNFDAWYSPAKGAKYGWLGEHTPATFIKHSVVWFSHQITERLGKEKLNQYLEKLNYGNMDISGTPGKNDGLINSWLGSSLKISAREQVRFLEKLFVNEPALSNDAKEKTREILALDEEWDGWKLYGKSGGGEGEKRWFVGWIEKHGERIIFAQYLVLPDRSVQEPVAFVTRRFAKENMLKVLDRKLGFN